MSELFDDIANDNEIATRANTIIAEAQGGCEERFGPDGQQLKTRHVYRGGSSRCCCNKGPDLSLRRER